LVLAYILLVGPADYFLLRKLRRMEWTWITFPAIVVAVSLGAYFLAYRLKGDQLRLNQVDIVDVDASSGRIRGTTWVNVFSPRMKSYDLSFRPRLLNGQPATEASTLTSWLGLPGDALGGMRPRGTGGRLWAQGYAFSPQLDVLKGVPIQVWSTKSITTRWSAAAEIIPEAKLVGRDDLLTGTVTNTLGFRLTDCVLAHDRYAYELGTLEPGVPVDLAQKERPELKTLLTGKTMVPDTAAEDWRLEVTPYDHASRDIRDVLRVMMLFEAAGGRRYTRLLNRYQSFVDLSGLLKTDRAVLIGWVPPDRKTPEQGGAELLDDGQPLGSDQDTHSTVYRFVFPVRQAGPAKRRGSRF
jgi:hypothetical protein